MEALLSVDGRKACCRARSANTKSIVPKAPPYMNIVWERHLKRAVEYQLFLSDREERLERY